MKRKYFRTRKERRHYRDEVQKHDEFRMGTLNSVLYTLRGYSKRHPEAPYTEADMRRSLRHWMRLRCSWY